MITDTARRLLLPLIGDIIAEKRSRGVSPDYALSTEIQAAIAAALASLVADGTITRRLASVNKIPAYSIPSSHVTTI